MLAGHLKMTVGELERRMDSRELSEWLAFARYFQPLDNSWAQTGVIASAALAPYCKRGATPRPADFVPIAPAPQHPTQMTDVLFKMKKDLSK